ncbi:hypothetical protein PF004_g16897 [Phytophthora fragariae]|uniref:Uncharacterized protein n=1 Tax=Phytophthora fragariae TaxID=53985 RepID=A0A6A3J8J7_9STRA|nr:hypothetical protein PF011_g17879 [Phytophthora fragariae]KAE9207936.1 hypothetical protein PF004_g16897 [Phytophthora fragariae]
MLFRMTSNIVKTTVDHPTALNTLSKSLSANLASRECSAPPAAPASPKSQGRSSAGTHPRRPHEETNASLIQARASLLLKINATNTNYKLTAAIVMPEHPARLLLYYRLWEEKVVIDFKERGLTDPTTRYKNVTDRWTHTFVVLQSLGGMGVAVYKTLSVAPFLQDINGSFKHYQGDEKEKNDTSSQTYRDRAAKAIEQVQFVPEWRVKYDIMAIQTYAAKVLAAKSRKANSMNANEPTKAAAVAQCQEEKKWLKMLGMWIVNSKESYFARWGDNSSSFLVRASTSSLYANKFVTSQWYNDDRWHRAGSFGQMDNIAGSTNVLQKFSCIVVCAIIAIEVYGLVSAN